MVHRSRGAGALVSLALLLIAPWATSCGSGAATTASSPQPAVSVSVLPEVEPGRVIIVFIRDHTSTAKKLAFAEEIAQMPEVEAYHFVSKREALEHFAEQYGEDITTNLPINPLPASFDIVVRDGVDVESVARRFYDEPIVANDPGTHNGVQVGGTIAAAPSPSP
jgi:hypothetical protein